MIRSTPVFAASWYAPSIRRIALGLAACATLAAALPQPAHAQWRWRDKDGQVNASDRPPPRGVPDKDILSRPAPELRRQAAAAPAATASAAAPVAASAPPTALEREVQARKRQAEQEAAAKARADEDRQAVIRAENCRAARSQLNTLESGQRVARSNDKGEREILDDKGRADETRRARDVIASDCR